MDAKEIKAIITSHRLILETSCEARPEKAIFLNVQMRGKRLKDDAHDLIEFTTGYQSCGAQTEEHDGRSMSIFNKLLRLRRSLARRFVSSLLQPLLLLTEDSQQSLPGVVTDFAGKQATMIRFGKMSK